MAKVAAKTSAKSPKKTSAKTSPEENNSAKIEKACLEALDKLKSLGIEQQLQHDIEWCLGSYRADKNPVGLYDMAERALTVLREAKEKKAKGVTAKTLTDLEKAIQLK